MNLAVVARYLGIVLFILGGAMLLSVPWAFPAAGEAQELEAAGLRGLGGAMLLAFLGGGLLFSLGARTQASMLRKEALAVVGLSWIGATLLGAVPYILSGSRGTDTEVREWHQIAVDAIFESASGFTGTGSTIFPNLENASVLPRCILFWRQETHFLGSLGIMVLFVAILGHGAPGRRLMRTEMTGPIKDVPHTRIQHTAWAFSGIYVGLNALLTSLFIVQGMSLYDALCHSFATVATGGFSTYNASLAHFNHIGIEITATVFMVLACTNFMLLFWLLRGYFRPLLTDVEWLTYLGILAASTGLIMTYGLDLEFFDSFGSALRYASFQVVSIQTNTGLATADFDRWDAFSKALLLVLMFIGGCSGSTSCAIKVIRYCLMVKLLRHDLQRRIQSNVVRKVRLGGAPLDVDALERTVPLYFAAIGFIAVVGWLGLMATEPDINWIEAGRPVSEKPIDCVSAV
ncbi:MAG: TrkH family potassium uptake protein, partial [Planctomycetaceae bacterium]